MNISSDDEIEATISSVLGSVESERIRSYLKYLTAEPHIAAGPRDLELTDWIREGFIIFPSTSEELTSSGSFLYNLFLSIFRLGNIVSSEFPGLIRNT